MSIHQCPGKTESWSLADLWAMYKDHDDAASRQEIILRYAHLVKHVAGRLATSLPEMVDIGDLYSYGILGLIDAVNKFDPGRGVKFETYALARIRGAILDGLRSMDWVPRTLRQKSRELEKVIWDLENRLGRAATDQEISQQLHISVGELHRLVQSLGAANLLSLDEILRGESGGEEVTLREIIADNNSADPEALFESKELVRVLADAITALPERERLVITLYYYEGLTLKEIGRVLRVTEARACQIHSKAVLRLRAHLAGWQAGAPADPHRRGDKAGDGAARGG
ncbi:MAG: FliA/WhiG family RNA polymerase sigma factor [Firmicutes bacterium]|nr:FliA/WhiG family RNA polymerase sigma factor [Bacillota bacterium]